jgi:hypothetical protein
METKIKDHLHPKNGVIPIRGRRLQEGDKIEEGDVFDSPTGFWKTSPVVVGIALGKTNAIWIRPEKNLIVLLK